MWLNVYKDEDHSDIMANELEINRSNSALKFQPFGKSISSFAEWATTMWELIILMMSDGRTH